jgi:DnaJ-class molecular chaperone
MTETTVIAPCGELEWYGVEKVCPSCNGTGIDPRDRLCWRCEGNGFYQVARLRQRLPCPVYDGECPRDLS